MQISSCEIFKEIIDSKIPIELKIHIFESDISELIYRIWCRLTGGKFVRKQIDRRNCCVLVTKEGFHLISTIVGLFNSHSISSSELEVYKRNCSGPKPPDVSRTMYWHWWLKYVEAEKSNCEDCGRPYELQDGDEKIVGKFEL
jgi:hypothetical protein